MARLLSAHPLNPLSSISMQPHLLTRVCTKGATLVTFTIRHLDEKTTQAVKQQLMDLAAGIGPHELHLDFEKVDSMGSTALAMLVALSRNLSRGKGHVVLINVADHLVELFQLTR